MSRLPLIGVTACTKQIGLHPYHITGDKYVRAVAVAAKGLPLIIPSLAELIDPTDILDGLDGLLFTGSPSNIEPQLYHGPASAPGTLHDPDRDRAGAVGCAAEDDVTDGIAAHDGPLHVLLGGVGLGLIGVGDDCGSTRQHEPACHFTPPGPPPPIGA